MKNVKQSWSCSGLLLSPFVQQPRNEAIHKRLIKLLKPNLSFLLIFLTGNYSIQQMINTLDE